ncbi:hypothetical protein BN14_10282 [Rhizoctonia solani AG-1 IB]|uniref:Uncharacterized protein n=1 Tax=Thanatephorus cucumeris (strain AG1-IB / isolate 7/3/14) TaxID=1108050 RepID=M5CGI1_THACB|nr:hypothetical protein BN14_10282 [Rhizoctonia solani AG-1 IB]
MSNAHHFPKLSSKPSIPPTPRDTPALGTGLGGRSKNITAISNSGADSSSLPDSPVISTRQKTDQRRTVSSDDEPPHTYAFKSRPGVHAERELNAFRDNMEGMDRRLKVLEEAQARTEKQQDSMDTKLDFLVNAVKGGASAPPALVPSTTQEEKPRIGPSNPPPNPDHKAMAERIQGRRDRDKALEQIPSEFKSQAQALTRTVVKALLTVKKLTSDAPPFYYKNGQPDFFPAEFTHKGYCKPHPHWDKSFADNYHWFATYIDAWKKSIPEDGSAFEKASKQFTDRQILVLLHDGPFSSLVTGYKNAHPRRGGNRKSSADEKTKRREVSRLEGKAFKRQSYRSEMKEMAGQRWNPAWSKQVMSPVVTDDEGGQVVQQPAWRARWWTKALIAMDNAERASVLAKPGIHPPLPKTTIVVASGPPPSIYTGTGENRKIVKIPLVLISKEWRNSPTNAAWMEASAHLIDSTLTRKPDLSAFIAAHPPPVEPDQAKAKDEVEYEDGGEGEDQGNIGIEWEYDGEDEGENEHEDGGDGKNKYQGGDQGEGGEEGVGEIHGDWFTGGNLEKEYGDFGTEDSVPNVGVEQVVESGGGNEDDEDEDDLYASDPAPTAPALVKTQPLAAQEPELSQAESDIAIDPRILKHSSSARPRRRPQIRPITTAGFPLPASTTQPNSAVSSALPPTPQDAAWPPHGWAPNVPQRWYPTATMDPTEHEPSPPNVAPEDSAFPNPPPPMPAPPTLSQQERDMAESVTRTAFASRPTAKKKGQTVGSQKVRTQIKQAKQMNPGPSTSTAPGALNSGEEPVQAKRKRGRPPGAKNKKTVEKERLAAEAARQHGES